MAARDLHAAPPNTSQLEEAEFDIEKATEAQQGELDEKGVAKLNEKIAAEGEKSREFWEKKRDERISEGEGVHLGDPLKTSKSTPGSLEADKAEKKTDSK